MATLASTNVTGTLSSLGEQPVAFGEGGLLVEFFRAAGGAVGDTVAITPKFITDIRAVQAQQSSTNGLGTSANTNVTLTLTASAATNTAFDVMIIGRR